MDEEKEKTVSQEPIAFSQPNENGVRFYAMDEKNKQSKNSKLKKSLIAFGIILAIIILIGVACSMGTGTEDGGTGNVYPEEEYIAKISVEGTIAAVGNTDYLGTPIGYQHQWTLKTIDELIDDENNKGILLFVDSPGGGVYESDELYLKIKEYKEKTGRPVYSTMGNMAASGGYYISAPCDKIIANRNSWTGSIGVAMGTMFDFSGFLEKYGIKTNTLTSGANKAMGSSVAPMTEEQKQILQSMVDEAYLQFVGIVSEGRGLDVDKVKKLADGRIYTAKQALALGLVDQIGTVDEAVADMQKNYNLQDCEVVDIRTEESSVFGSLLGKIDFSKLEAGGDAAAILELVENSNEFPISYTCEMLK